MVQTTQPTIERAKARVEQERELVSREREAFEQFLARLRDVNVTRPEARGAARTGTGAATLLTHSAPPTDQLATVRTAYRETVMDTPHYQREYGDGLNESMGAELGAELARHVVNGGTLTSTLYAALVEASEEARDDRAGFLRRLDREAESLQQIERELNDVESRVIELQKRIPDASDSGELAAIDADLQSVERRCADLARRRQELIHNRGARPLSGVDGVSLVRYLYDGMETTTPALHDITARLETIRYWRKRCLR